MDLLFKIWTAIFYFLSGAGLLVLIHRWVEPLSRRAALVLLLLPLCFTGKALLLGRVYAPIDLAYRSQPLASVKGAYGIDDSFNWILSDVHCQNIPARKAVRYAYRHGEWPLWNPFVFCGEPLAGTAQPAPYSFLTLLSLLLPLHLSFTFTASLGFLVAGLGAYLYARHLGCRLDAALLAAGAWMFSSFVVFWSGWPMGATVALLPWLLVAAGRVVRRPGLPSALFLTLVLTQVMLAGHPESSAHVIVAGLVLGVFELAQSPVSRWKAAVGWSLAAGGIALGLSAVYLLPILDVLPQTVQLQQRQATQEIIHRGASLGDAGAALLDSFFPFLHGASAFKEVAHKPNHLIPFSGAYAGTVLLAPALFALWRSRWRGRWVLGLLGLVGLLAGAKMPGFFPLVGKLPLFDISLNDRLIFLTALALSVLAALGVEVCMRGKAQAQLAALTAVVLALYLVGLAYLWPGMLGGGLDLSFVLRHSLLATVPLAVCAALWKWLPTSRWLLPLLLLTLLVQRTGEMEWFYPALPTTAFYPRVAPLHKLPQTPDPYRLVGHQYALLPNDSTLYELEDVRGYGALHNLRFAQTWPLWSRLEPMWFLRVPDLDRPFLSFLNVRFALVGREIRRHHPWSAAARGRDIALWENRRALPRAFVPRRVRLGVGPQATLAQMAEAQDFSELAWIDDGSPPIPGSPLELTNGPGQVVLRRHGTGYRLHAEMAAPGWVVVSTTAWRGWRARSGNQDLTVDVANHAFLAVKLPRGSHPVELFYRPRAFDRGLAVTVSTLIGLAAVGAGSSFRRLRRAHRERGAPTPSRSYCQ